MGGLRLRQAIKASLVVTLFLLGMTLACSRTPAVNASTEVAGEGPLPFDRAAKGNGISPTGAITPAQIPAGTPITVRLQAAISSKSSHSGDSFEAFLDEPLIVDGETVAPRGAAVTGRVVAARAAGALDDPGYLRLMLSTISFDGKPLPLQTSNIFVKGSSHEKRSLALPGGGKSTGTIDGDIGFSTERRLTFRLIQPVPLHG